MSKRVLNRNINQITKRIEKWKPLLRMERWEIQVTPLRAADIEAQHEAAAYVDNPEYLHAEIGVTDQEFSDKHSDLELLAVHELLHVLMSHVDANVYRITASLSSNATTDLTKELVRVYDESTETFCEHLSRIIVSLHREPEAK